MKTEYKSEIIKLWRKQLETWVNLTACAQRQVSLQTKYRMFYRYKLSYVFSILLYGVDIWTLKTLIVTKVTEFQLWLFSRMLRILWADHTPNREVLRRMRTGSQILTNYKNNGNFVSRTHYALRKVRASPTHNVGKDRIQPRDEDQYNKTSTV